LKPGTRLLLETQLSADAASQTIGQRVAKPLGPIDTAPRWRSMTWPRTRGLNEDERARFRSSWFDPEELTLTPRGHPVFDRKRPRSWRSFRTRELQSWGCSTFAIWLSTLLNRSSISALCSRRIRKNHRHAEQPCLQRVPQQASYVVNFLQQLMVPLPTSAKLKSEVPTWSVGHPVRTGTVSPGWPRPAAAD
jgi:hypothetical protein